MREFAALYAALDASTATLDKVDAIRAWLAASNPTDAAWGIHLLCGARLGRVLSPAALRRLAMDASALPDWLVEECYAHVGDLAETVALLVPDAGAAPPDGDGDIGLAAWVDRIVALRDEDEPTRIRRVHDWLGQIDPSGRFMLLKLLTGALRVGVSRGLVTRAVAAHAALPGDVVAERLGGGWAPSAESFDALVAPVRDGDAAVVRPMPFCLASPLVEPADALGDRRAWLAEWKWDGIRAQIVRDGDRVRLWSRGDESLDGRFPELEAAAATLPDGVVLDGEVLGWRADRPLPFAALQRRINRLKPGARLLADCPVRFLAYDLLRTAAGDLRERPLSERRSTLEALLAATPAALGLSPAVATDDWPTLGALRGTARERGVEGLMLKRLDSPYRAGRRRGDWWKWKLDPLTIDAVLVYAQAGRGRRASLHTDYTFALWHGGALLPVAKAYSGLDDAEIARLDRWIRAHTLERFGPVRQVEPHHVFELGFEGVQRSTRHKSGVAVRFPRILRWRVDKPAAEADRLETLQRMAGDG
jgi:DNA ligase-1